MTQDLLPTLGYAAPALLMAAAAALAWRPAAGPGPLWRTQLGLSALAGVAALLGAVQRPDLPLLGGWCRATPLGTLLALLVQGLGTVITAYSARYLEGEPAQRRYLGALAGVLAAVQTLLLADRWPLLIAAWSLTGLALQPLLCFYADRPFARLAAHKKRLADLLADGLLVLAAALCWRDLGTASLSALGAEIAARGMTPGLQWSAAALVLAVALRSALMPVHGWLTQVMEAPTPVSALLHAGVVNLGGYVLIRLAPLLEGAAPARALLLGLGLGTAVLAGLVTMTRVSIKVRLAWSTLAQMGFMLLECALGLYSLAALHLLGHSLYKAQAFLAAAGDVRRQRAQQLYRAPAPAAASLWLAPAAAIATVLALQALAARAGLAGWPWWWSALLGLAWAPLLWLPGGPEGRALRWRLAGSGLLMLVGLTAAALLGHALPLGLRDAPREPLGLAALLGMALLHGGIAALQKHRDALDAWRRWSYAGFYLDEAYTRLALRLWPTRWAPPIRTRPADARSGRAGAFTS
ncbi:MAG: NADH-quinone oxidoreductase subunit L [Pelomonas sp.]|nr:NADH-quinone oxidoreductase subunit L [Roseateles sp.]